MDDLTKVSQLLEASIGAPSFGLNGRELILQAARLAAGGKPLDPCPSLATDAGRPPLSTERLRKRSAPDINHAELLQAVPVRERPVVAYINRSAVPRLVRQGVADRLAGQLLELALCVAGKPPTPEAVQDNAALRKYAVAAALAQELALYRKCFGKQAYLKLAACTAAVLPPSEQPDTRAPQAAAPPAQFAAVLDPVKNAARDHLQAEQEPVEAPTPSSPVAAASAAGAAGSLACAEGVTGDVVMQRPDQVARPSQCEADSDASRGAAGRAVIGYTPLTDTCGPGSGPDSERAGFAGRAGGSAERNSPEPADRGAGGITTVNGALQQAGRGIATPPVRHAEGHDVPLRADGTGAEPLASAAALPPAQDGPPAPRTEVRAAPPAKAGPCTAVGQQEVLKRLLQRTAPHLPAMARLPGSGSHDGPAEADVDVPAVGEVPQRPAGADTVALLERAAAILIQRSGGSPESARRMPRSPLAHLPAGPSLPKRPHGGRVATAPAAGPAEEVAAAVRRFVRAHLDPLVKAGVIDRTLYRAAAQRTLDRVLSTHPGAQSADFLICKGDRIRRLAQTYVEQERKARAPAGTAAPGGGRPGAGPPPQH